MKKYKPLRYDGAAVVFSEVPDEISLAISITGCPRRCPGCHSEYLWEYHGNLLLKISKISTRSSAAISV